ncbi:hypothetical protein A2955_03900 [Candidatus Woesebacteria bacterium RIFCSPLOWO2_01_FULL_37_19]|uniref:ROK family protein n=1 Tax=Candidatus Woesebacteria bacterium RIFCSPLOWO2_01_FULL_37_19 TaxID=1802514 RepID=A0A1F8B6Q4_9BACT|nr:MAG: hypothetical protein A2955_03900 [Candidatus Woesebacteria bacterium RIFCSPLOWO2_01_FULL_37_19]
MYILFDIGGTKMRLSVSSDGATYAEPKVYSTPQNFTDGMQIFEEYYSEVKDQGEVESVVGGLPGVLDKKRSYLISAPNLQGWIGKKAKESLEGIFKASVFLENDTAIVGLGEATKGAGKGFSIVAYLGVGTGVGGARIVEGKIDRSIYGFEPGHQYIDADASMAGKLVDLEYFVSGAGLMNRYSKVPSEITDHKVWEEMERNLAFGINNTIVHWSPDVLVLGGGLIINNFIRIDKVLENLRKVLTIFPYFPEIRKATLGDFGGLEGTIAYLKLTK